MASFWHVCDCETAWCDNTPRQSRCPSCDLLVDQGPLSKLYAPIRTALSHEPCPSFGAEEAPK